nr:hypothetical protein [Tanacetum cinerariifolium]
NKDKDAAFDGNEHDFDAKKHDSVVILSSSSSAQSRKQDDKTKKEDKGKNPPNIWKSSFIDASQLPNDLDMPELEDITYSDDEDVVGVEADFNNLESSIPIEAIQKELLQFKMQKVWVLVDPPYGKRAVGTKWVYRNKKDERGIVIRNKARLVAQGHTQEEGIDYEEVFASVARIEAIRLFLAYASFMGFMVYQMDVKSAFLYETIEEEVNKARLVARGHTQEEGIDCEEVFGLVARIKAIRLFLAYASFMGFMVYLMDAKSAFLYGTIKEEVYICQPLGFEDSDHPDKVYKVVKALYGLHQAPRAWYETLDTYLLENGKSASTPIDTEKPLLKDPDGKDVDVHTYRSMIGSLMYLISSRPDIMFAVCACVHFQVTPKASHLHAVKRIFRYLKGKPHLGLWYPKDSPFDLVAYSDSDYAGASLDIKSTTGGCQFLG